MNEQEARRIADGIIVNAARDFAASTKVEFNIKFFGNKTRLDPTDLAAKAFDAIWNKFPSDAGVDLHGEDELHVTLSGRTGVTKQQVLDFVRKRIDPDATIV